MLRDAKNAGFVLEGAWFWKRYDFYLGKQPVGSINPDEFAQAVEAQETKAVRLLVGDDESRQYWWYQWCFYWDEDYLSARDVEALIYERDRRKQRKLERARAVVATDSLPRQLRREVISREVRQAVFERDGGRCVECESNFDIQYDHVIPVVRGGANTVANLQILCAPCNQRKGAAL